MFEKRVMGSMYERASRPEDLPWHVEAPPTLLVDAVREVRARSPHARAIDLGCGAGVYATYLAKEGFEVTGLDLFPKAIELARAHAKAAGVNVDFVATELFAWKPERPVDQSEASALRTRHNLDGSAKPSTLVDLVLDSGCLHSLIDGSVPRYVAALREMLAPGGEYVLGHWGKRHALDWRPMGPRRRTADALAAALAPDFVEIARHEELMRNVPMPFGPTVLGIAMRFRRASSR